MHVALVSCDHGLGHVRRSRIIANELAARGCKVTVLCPIAKWQRFENWPTPENGSVEVIDFATHTSPANLRGGVNSAIYWDARLPNLDAYDAVISDTLPEVLSRRSDATIVAQFFWHDVVDEVDVAFQARAQRLLEEHQPVIVGSSMFAMPAVAAQPRFHGVGLFHTSEPMAEPEPMARTDLLLTGGSTPESVEIFAGVFDSLGTATPWPFITSWIDPQFTTDLPRSRPANFDRRMFTRLKLAVCRPGLGVVTELIAHHVPMLLVYEQGNREMRHNAQVLVDAGLAIDVSRSTTSIAQWLDPSSWWRFPQGDVGLDAAGAVVDQIFEGTEIG